MKKASPFPLLIAVAAALGGCAVPFHPPADVANLDLTRVDSATVLVDKLWLERANGVLVVRGYVQRRLDAESTARTHLDVSAQDTNGRALRTVVAGFTPQDIPPRNRRPMLASYRVALDPLPAATARIEVRAHDGEMH